MPKERTVNLNGTFYSAGKLLGTDNRGFLYGDSLFETMRVADAILLWELHFARLRKGAETLGYIWPRQWTSDFFKFDVLRTLKENRLKNGIVRLVMFRNEGGRYTPLTDNCSYLIDVEPLEGKAFEWQESGLHSFVFEDWKKHISPVASFKSAQSLLYVMAGREARIRNLQEPLIINEKRNICESLGCNVFLYLNKQWHTPALSEGCVEGVMRTTVLELMREKGNPADEGQVNAADLHKAEEIMVCNSVRGIRWIEKIENTTYKNDQTKSIHDMLVKTLEL